MLPRGGGVHRGFSRSNKGRCLNHQASPQWGHFRSNTMDSLAHLKTYETSILPRKKLIRSRCPCPNRPPVSTLYPLSFTLNPQPLTLYPPPSTLNPLPSTLNPLPSTPNPQTSNLYPLPSTLNPHHPNPNNLHSTLYTLLCVRAGMGAAELRARSFQKRVLRHDPKMRGPKRGSF